MIKLQLYFSMFKKRPVFMRESIKIKPKWLVGSGKENLIAWWRILLLTEACSVRINFGSLLREDWAPDGCWHFWAVFKNKEAMSLPDPCCVPEFMDATVCQLPLGFWQGRRLGSCHDWSFWSPELDQRRNSGLLSGTETRVVLVSFVHLFITFKRCNTCAWYNFIIFILHPRLLLPSLPFLLLLSEFPSLFYAICLFVLILVTRWV